ncbi:putative RNA-directed DNA polymerase [Helianthus anomalus]
MQTEFSALQENDTWELVPRPSDRPVTRCMWIFRHKFKSDGSLERYKARLVVNGNSQTVGIDCEDTFSPVVKPATIRIVLSVAVCRSWPIHQLDVKNAFLHGDLKETVFMHQPPGFVDKRFPNFVCRLKKSLYGLKQAPRAWYTRFATHILSQGFRSSVCDNSLFVYYRGSQTAYLLLYVDDIVLTASSDELLQDIIRMLSREFAMTDLGPLHHFLGVKVTRTSGGLFLDQAQYTKDIISRASMSSCKPCTTPVDLSTKLSASDGSLFHDPTLYRSLAGALQYLTFTRPDISYAVQQVCLFMHAPRDPHFAFLKRILRYLQGTVDYGIRIGKSNTHSLVAYSDADWGGCPDSRRSTSGYCVFLGDNLISWSSKRQPTISRSSAEAEYRGVANAVAEATWLRNLLLELHLPLRKASVIYCDNVSAVYMSDNPVQHQRTKHIEIDIHFVREKVRVGHIRVLHVPSALQFADIFTKGLARQLFQSFRSSLSVCPPPAQTAGES